MILYTWQTSHYDHSTLLVFTDSSTNNYFDWDGTTTPENFMSEEGAMNVALDGLDINGDWFLIVGGDGAAGCDGTPLVWLRHACLGAAA